MEHIKKIYNQGQVNQFEALHDVTLEIKDGEMVALIGKSGAGKSTLLHILGCIDRYNGGEYYFGDKLVKDMNESEMARMRNEKIGIVMQNYALVPELTCMENVILPLDFSKRKIKNKMQLCEHALETVDMLAYKKTPISKLSGGQKQRVAIARAIVNHPELILADEPTGALDVENSAEIMSLFHKLNKTGVTIVIITHDLEIAGQCDRVIRISDGNIIMSDK